MDAEGLVPFEAENESNGTEQDLEPYKEAMNQYYYSGSSAGAPAPSPKLMGDVIDQDWNTEFQLVGRMISIQSDYACSW